MTCLGRLGSSASAMETPGESKPVFSDGRCESVLPKGISIGQDDDNAKTPTSGKPASSGAPEEE